MLWLLFGQNIGCFFGGRDYVGVLFLFSFFGGGKAVLFGCRKRRHFLAPPSERKKTWSLFLVSLLWVCIGFLVFLFLFLAPKDTKTFLVFLLNEVFELDLWLKGPEAEEE